MATRLMNDLWDLLQQQATCAVRKGTKLKNAAYQLNVKSFFDLFLFLCTFNEKNKLHESEEKNSSVYCYMALEALEWTCRKVQKPRFKLGLPYRPEFFVKFCVREEFLKKTQMSGFQYQLKTTCKFFREHHNFETKIGKSEIDSK